MAGLYNLGNTCFLNSCIQILNQIDELYNLLMTKPGWRECTKPDTILVSGWVELRKMMMDPSNARRIVMPRLFINQLYQTARAKKHELFSVGMSQNDITEFLTFMIDCMHNVLAKPMLMQIRGKSENDTDEIAIQCYKMFIQTYANEYSEILPLFHGIYLSEIWSQNSHVRHTVKPEIFLQLDLPIPLSNKHNTLYDCFDQFTRGEYLDGENAWFNEKTGQKENIWKRIQFWSLPKILIITLQRFGTDHKKMDVVDFPVEEELDVSKYVAGYTPEKYKYRLFGVCSHIGSLEEGHYVAYTKSTTTWTLYNDENIQEVSGKSMVSCHAYCLAYRRIGQ